MNPRGRSVRKAASRYSPTLGSLRHVEACHAPWWFVVVAAIIMAGICVFGAIRLPESLVGILLFAGLAFIVVVILIRMMGTRKHLVFDHGVVTGTFRPGGKQYAISWTQVDRTSIRAFTAFGQVEKMVETKTVVDGGMNRMVWLDGGVTFVGPLHEAALRWPDGMGGLFDPMPPPQGLQLWLLGVKKNPEQLIHAITAAMINVGVPEAAQIPHLALPPQKLTGRREDFAQIPGSRGRGPEAKTDWLAWG